MKKYLLICSLFGLAGNNSLAMEIVKSEKTIENKNNASILDVLPPEIIVDILEKTDVQTVGRAARTCKTMRALAVPALKTIAEPDRLNETLVKEVCAEGRNDSGAINYLLSLGARIDISEFENSLARFTLTKICGIITFTESIPLTITDNMGTPLHGAAVCGNKYLAQLALEKRIPIDTVDKSGYTPLHYAVLNVRENINMVRFLLDKGANPNIFNNQRFTPLHAAASLGHANIARLLLEKNADVNATDLFGRTPLQVAEETHLENVALLLKSFQKK